MKHIVYQPYEPRDFKALSDIVKITWGHGKSYTAAAAVRLSNAYLWSCLAEQTFIQVALDHEKPVGVIMGKDLRGNHSPLLFRLRARLAAVILSLTAEGRRAWHFYGEVDRIYGELLSGQTEHYEGELSFFAIHPDYRGFGIGKELYRRFLNYMDSEGIERFYVFTDTTCNYVFYERQNMVRCGTEEVTLQVNGNPKDFLFFIYENAAGGKRNERES